MVPLGCGGEPAAGGCDLVVALRLPDSLAQHLEEAVGNGRVLLQE